MKKLVALMVLCGFMAAGSAAADDGEIKWDTVPDETKTALYEAQQDMNGGKMDKALSDLLKFQQKRPNTTIFWSSSISARSMACRSSRIRQLRIWKKPWRWKNPTAPSG